MAETKLVKGKEGQGEGKREREGENKRRESKRLNLVIFLICAFLVALSIHAGVLTKQSVKTALYSLIGSSMDSKTNTVIYLFQVYFIIHGS